MDGVEQVAEAVRVARLPPTTDTNPYQRLLYDHLRAEGVELVGDGHLDTAWLDANRDRVDVLHLHWRLARLLGLDDGNSPAPAAGHEDAPAAAARLDRQLTEARDRGYAIAWTVHEIGQLGGQEPTLEHLAAVVLGRHADVVMAHDEVAAAHVRALELCPPDRLAVVPLGHYRDAHLPDGPLHRADLGIAADAVVLLAFGQRRWDKAFDVLLDAFAQVSTPGVVLVLAGRDGDHDTSADPRIIDLGHVPDHHVAALHHLADATVSARSEEWTPSSLVLSLSHGCPVVAADLASVTEHGGPGVFTFHPGDAADLAATMCRVALDPEERRIRGAAGQAFVLANTWPQTAAATAAALRRALAGRR